MQKNNDVHPQNPLSDTTGTGSNGNQMSYNKSDTTINLQNGRITLDIPAGAIKEGIQVGLSNSSVDFIDTANMLYQFELTPSGIQFEKPVTLMLHYDSTWLKGYSPWDIGIAYKNDSDGKWYPAVNGNVDTVNHTISIKTTHFSHWCIYTCLHLYMKADGQLSEDYSQTIRMQPGDIGLLLLTMDEPPAWESDPDKNKEFGNPLIAPLTTPPIDPKESYSKSLAPDEWDVNAIMNGDEHVGEIMPVSGGQEKLYQYIAPSQVPDNNPIAISATIHTVNDGDIILIQPVEILGKWKLSFSYTGILACDGNDGIGFTEKYSQTVFFHLDKDLNIVYDDNTYEPVTISDISSCDACLKITSWKADNMYFKISGITGKFDPNVDSLYCKLNYDDHPGQVYCSGEDVCDNLSGYGWSMPVSDEQSSVQINLPLQSPFTKDTTIQIQMENESFKGTTIIKLESIKK